MTDDSEFDLLQLEVCSRLHCHSNKNGLSIKNNHVLVFNDAWFFFAIRTLSMAPPLTSTCELPWLPPSPHWMPCSWTLSLESASQSSKPC